MGILWWIISVAVVIVWVLTIFDLFRWHLGAGTTVAWLLLIIILPFIGAAIYWLVRRPDPATSSTPPSWIASVAPRRSGARSTARAASVRRDGSGARRT